jgi:hypothetical protein
MFNLTSDGLVTAGDPETGFRDLGYLDPERVADEERQRLFELLHFDGKVNLS